jgi:hypothetical protein
MDKTVKGPDLAVMFSECPKYAQGGGSTERYSLRLCVIEDGDKVRNISCSRWENPHIDLRNLEIQCYVSWDRDVWNAYGFCATFNDYYHICREDAEGMVRTFKKLERIKAKHVEKYGHPQTFAQYVQMIVVGLGVKHLVRVRGRETGWHNQNEHQFLPIGELPAFIEQSMEAARLYHFPAKEEVA